MSEANIKVVLMGEACVGKTSIVTRLTKNTFYQYTFHTVGVAYCPYKNDEHSFEFWDTAGQERFASMCKLYYRDAKIIMLVFDLTQPETFDKIIRLINEVSEVNLNGKFILIGNKIDLIDTVDQLYNKDRLPDYLDEEESVCFNISAKDGTNFDLLVNRLNQLANNIEKKDTPSVITTELNNSYSNCSC